MSKIKQGSELEVDAALLLVNRILVQAGRIATSPDDVLVRPKPYGRALRMIARQLVSIQLLTSASLDRETVRWLMVFLEKEYRDYEQATNRSPYPRRLHSLHPIAKDLNGLLKNPVSIEFADLHRCAQHAHRLFGVHGQHRVRSVTAFLEELIYAIKTEDSF